MNRDIEKLSQIKKLMTNSKYNFNEVCNEISKNALNIEVKTITEAIERIEGINLFRCINLSKNLKEKIDIPFKFNYCQIVAKSEKEVKKILKIKDTDNVKIEQCIEDEEIYTVYKIKEAYYEIFCSKMEEYYIAIYNNEYETSSYDKYNFIEVFQILFFNDYKECIAKLIELLEIKVIYVEHFKTLCNTNISYLENNIVKYKSLQKLIRKQMMIFKEIYHIGILDYHCTNKLKEENEMFFSTRHLAEKVGKSKNTIIPYINTFVLLDFYNKKYLHKESTGDILKNKSVLYEVLPITEEVLIEADKISKKLIENKVTISKVSKKILSALFSQEIVKNVFLDNKFKE